MNIVISENDKKIEKVKKQGELIKELINLIFSICKNDKNFLQSNEIGKNEIILNDLKLKVEKNNKLYLEAKKLESDLAERISTINGEIYSLKEKILEMLGSEI